MISQAELARRVGKHRHYINAIIRGVEKGTYAPRCSIELAAKIQEESDGQWMAVFFRPDLKEIAKKVISTL